MSLPLPQLMTSNIKISFFLTSLPLPPSLEFLTKYRKIRFPSTQIINFRGIRSLDQVPKIRSELEEIFGIRIKEEYRLIKKKKREEEKKKTPNLEISFFIISSPLPSSLEFLTKYKIGIYKHSPELINVTGIQSLDDVHQIRSEMEETFSLKIDKEYRVDNIMASRKVQLKFDLKKIIQTIRKKEYDKVFDVDYDLETYAQRIFLKPLEKPFPSIQLLYTGSVTVMGCKSIDHLKFCQNVIDRLYSLDTLRERKREKST